MRSCAGNRLHHGDCVERYVIIAKYGSKDSFRRLLTCVFSKVIGLREVWTACTMLEIVDADRAHCLVARHITTNKGVD